MRASALLLIALLGLGSAGTAAETGDRNASATNAFETGLALLKQADATKSGEARAAQYRAALEQFDAAIAQAKDLCDAHVSAAYCLSQIAALTSEVHTHEQLANDALRRYESSVQCPGTQARVYGSWAALLISESGRVTDTPRRREMLERAAKLLNTGLRQANSKAERAWLLYQYGRVELSQTRLVVNRAGKRTLYESSLAHFQTASEVDSVAEMPALYASWGVALLELSRLGNDPMLRRQAIERLQTALEKKPARSHGALQSGLRVRLTRSDRHRFAPPPSMPRR